jgi:hypothetical protein
VNKNGQVDLLTTRYSSTADPKLAGPFRHHSGIRTYSFVSMISADESKETGSIRVESANLEDLHVYPALGNHEFCHFTQ